MKRILRNLVIIVLAVTAIDIAFGYFFKQVIFEKTVAGESGGNINYLLKNKKNADYVIFGTSRAIHHLDPDLLSSLPPHGYNAGINGVGSVIYNTALLDICLQHQMHPEAIILQLDALSFTTEIPDFNSSLKYLYPFYSDSKIMKDYVKKDGIKESLLVQSNLYTYNGKVLNILYNFFKRKAVVDHNGYEPLNQMIDTSIQSEPVSQDIVLNMSSKNFVALQDFCTMCQSHSIKLIIVMPPYFRNRLYNATLDRAFEKYLKEKCPRAYTVNLSNIDHCKDLQGYENWKDVAHLNSRGAAIFTKYVNDRLAKMEPQAASNVH